MKSPSFEGDEGWGGLDACPCRYLGPMEGRDTLRPLGLFLDRRLIIPSALGAN